MRVGVLWGLHSLRACLHISDSNQEVKTSCTVKRFSVYEESPGIRRTGNHRLMCTTKIMKTNPVAHAKCQTWRKTYP